MSDADNPQDGARTALRITVSVAPLSNADERIVDLLGSLAYDMTRLVGCSGRTSSNANFRTSEETAAVMQSNLLSTGELRVEMSLEESELRVHCTVSSGADAGGGTEAWFRLDEPEPETSTPATKTMRRKRADLLQGDLGALTAKSSTKKRFGVGVGRGPDDGGGGTQGSSPPSVGVIPLRKKP